MDRTKIQLLPRGQPRNWENSYLDWIGPCCLSRGPASPFLHGGRAGESTGKGTEAIHPGPLPDPARPGAPVDLRRAGLRVDEPWWRRAALPRLRRSLRARQHPGDKQSPLQRMDPDLPGSADDRRPSGPALPPLPHFRDERRELSLPRVDEIQEEPKSRVREVCRSCPERPFYRPRWVPLTRSGWVPLTRSFPREVKGLPLTQEDGAVPATPIASRYELTVRASVETVTAELVETS